MKNIILFAILVIVAGCSTEKRFQKQKKKATNFFLLNKLELAELCDTEFPEIPVKVVPGDTITKTDTVFIPGPKLVCPDSVTTLECPPSKIIKDTKIIRDSIFVKDTDQEYILKSEIKKLELEKEQINKNFEKSKDDLRDSDKKKTKWFWIFISLVVANFIYFGMKLYLKFQKP